MDTMTVYKAQLVGWINELDAAEREAEQARLQGEQRTLAGAYLAAEFATWDDE